MHTLTLPNCGHLPQTLELTAANREHFALQPARLFQVSYILRNGDRGVMDIISRSRSGALGRVTATYAEQVRFASARVVS